MVLQPGSDKEENVVGAFSDSDTGLLDSDDDYIPVHDDEWSDVCEVVVVFFTPRIPFWITCPKKNKRSVMKIKCKVKLPLKITLYSF